MGTESDRRAPLAVTVARWSTDPDIATAYSYLRPGGTPADRELLAQPVGPGFVLAGEATSLEFPGTMHGAWFSGERAADLVLTAGHPRRAIVIGAGLSGIAAARRLSAAGVDTVVLEASTQVGGRARTDYSLGGPVQLGAAWVHGEEGNPIAEIARSIGIALEPSRWQDTAVFVDGEGRLDPQSERRIAAARDDVWRGLDAAQRDAAVTDALGPTLRRQLAHHNRWLSRIERLILERTVVGIYENLYAAPIDELSLPYSEEPFRLPGGDLTLLGGLDRVVAHACAGLDVRTSTRVDRIEGAGDEWTAHAAGEVHVGDAVVLTVPIGILHGSRIEIDPPLPREVTSALRRIGAGVVTKAFFAFEEPFWQPHWSFATIGPQRGMLELWVDVSATAGRPVLCAFATGSRAVTTETMAPDELMALAHRTLDSARVGP